MTPLTRRTLLLAVPALALAACTHDKEDTKASPSATAEPSPSQLDGVPLQSDSGGDEPMPADADKDTTKAATTAATKTMKVWVQGSTLDEQDWRKKLNATLTPNGQDVASRTWGYKVPDHKVTGDPEIIRANAATALLHVTTDYTTYEVTVVRADDGTWKTSNLTTDLREGGDQ